MIFPVNKEVYVSISSFEGCTLPSRITAGSKFAQRYLFFDKLYTIQERKRTSSKAGYLSEARKNIS